MADIVNFAAVPNAGTASNRPHHFIAYEDPAGAKLIANVDDSF
ncbi:hypothetical protein [Klebsiella quasipneumoniae]